MEKGSVSSAIIKSVVLIILGAMIVLGVYMMLTRTKKQPAKDENYVITVVDEITTTNLEKSYPASARKVVELYAKIMQTLYRETYTEDQRDAMIAVLQGLMDDELLANNVNFAGSIQVEVNSRKAQQYSIPAYVVQTKEPEEIMVDGRKMCSCDCLFNLRNATTPTYSTYYTFILRRDQNTGNWKILGWTLKEEE
ncbi:MAG: hypothetical protein K6C96_09650 [Butyrivibrio sp.]|jgi:hypothetical protein|nr:hypothetical protein [Butyrivibrio sp.]